MNRHCFPFFGLLLILLLSGCFGGAPKSPYGPQKYAGVVTFGGAPVATGIEMVFTPSQGRSSGAIVRDGGKFFATYTPNEHGVQKGKSIITFQWTPEGNDGKPAPKEMEPLLTAYGPGTAGFEIDVQKPDTQVKLDIPKK